MAKRTQAQTVEAPTTPTGEPLLSVRNLRAVFNTDDGVVHAVDGVSFDIHRGEVFAVVGESGSGKSVTAMSLVQLQPTLDVQEGEILWKGRDLLSMSEREMRSIRGGEIAMIFQDPLTALNPVHTVGRQIGEMLRIHEGTKKRAAFHRAVELLELVGIPEPAKRAKSHPHEFSGGMRQRVMIAMAIACDPDLLIADEPTTALDVTVQAQVLEVLVEIKDEIDSAIMLITHDLGVVAGLADRVMVMYAGRQAEAGTTAEVFYESRHPYTLGLLASLPRVDDLGDAPLVPIVGNPPSLIHRPSGCPFHPRCRFARMVCQDEEPELKVVAGEAHSAACHFSDKLAEESVERLREEVDLEADTQWETKLVTADLTAGVDVGVRIGPGVGVGFDAGVSPAEGGGAAADADAKDGEAADAAGGDAADAQAAGGDAAAAEGTDSEAADTGGTDSEQRGSET